MHELVENASEMLVGLGTVEIEASDGSRRPRGCFCSRRVQKANNGRKCRTPVCAFGPGRDSALFTPPGPPFKGGVICAGDGTLHPPFEGGAGGG